MDNKALADIFVEHNRILKSKKILYKTYLDWYQVFLDYVSPLDGKKIIELGSGGGVLKEIAPLVITTDVIPLPGCDLVCRAEKLPFENESVDAIFMLNTLHHIPDCNTFLRKQKERCAIMGFFTSQSQLIRFLVDLYIRIFITNHLIYCNKIG